MAVVGFDIGSQSCYIGIARQGGIEVITNDYSLRATPTCISYGDRERSIGVAGRQKLMTNFQNTVMNFKHLIGRNFSDPFVTQMADQLPCQVVQLPGDNIGFKLTYLDESRVFTPEQVCAALLVKLKSTTEHFFQEEGSGSVKVTDCVISVPAYFVDNQRRAMLAAARIANLNCLRIMNEMTAVALSYGIYRQDWPEEGKPACNVLFVDVGASASQAALVAFNKGKLTVLGSVFDLGLGGNLFDRVLADHFSRRFMDNYKLDVSKNRRAYFKLLDECEKIKKQMSAASTVVPLRIECFMNDKDVVDKINRAEFDELCGPKVWDRFAVMFENLLSQTKMTPSDINIIEIVGGGTRIPKIKEIITHIFGKDVSSTMNQDEADCRGCAMQCAILSPTFRVREFSVVDAQPFEIVIKFPVSSDNSDESTKSMCVFERNDKFPFSKMITFNRKQPFTIESVYSEKLLSHIGIPKQMPIGEFKVTNIVPTEEGECRKVKVKARINANGLFSISSGSMLDKKVVTLTPEKKMDSDTVQQNIEANKVDDPSKAENDNAPSDDTTSTERDVPINVEGERNIPINVEGEEQDSLKNDLKQAESDNAGQGNEPSATSPPEKMEVEPQTKIKTISIDLPIEDKIFCSLSSSDIERLKEIERELEMHDRKQREAMEAKNSLEEYIYDMRDKLTSVLGEFATKSDCESLMEKLQKVEDWLYEDGDNVEKQIYEKELESLTNISDPIVERHKEFQTRPHAFESFSSILQLTQKAVDLFFAGDEKYDHLQKTDVERVRKNLEDKQKWLFEKMNKQQQLNLHDTPVIMTSQIEQEKQIFQGIVNPILNKPKPKVEEPPAPEPDPKKAETGTNEGEEKQQSGNQEQPTSQPNVEEVNGQMEID